MIYEYRKYQVVPGKRDVLNRRFAEVTLPIWERYGIRAIGFWEAAVGVTNELHYILQWESLAHREEVWGAFQRDDEWIAARALSEEQGQLISRIDNAIWQPTYYSELR